MAWEDINPGTVTGFGTGYGASDGGSGGVSTGMDTAVTSSAQAPPYSPESGLFWFGAFALAAAGGIFFVHHVRVSVSAGPANAAGDINV